MLRETPCSPPVPPLVKQLANRLSQQAGKCLVIPEGEEYGSSLREFHVKYHEETFMKPLICTS